MKYYQQAKNLVSYGLILIILSLYSFHSFCDDPTYELKELVAKLNELRKQQNGIRIGNVILDLATLDLSDQDRIQIQGDYQYHWNVLEVLNDMYYAVAMSPQDGNGRREFQPRYAVAFLQLITNVVYHNIRDVSTDRSIIATIANQADSIKQVLPRQHQRRGKQFRPSDEDITMADFLDRHGSTAANNGIWLLAMVFLHPARSMPNESMPIDVSSPPAVLSNIHANFDLVVDKYVTKRHGRHNRNSEQSRDDQLNQLLTLSFPQILQVTEFGPEFLPLVYYRALSLGVANYLISPSDQNLEQLRTVRSVLLNYLPADLHVQSMLSMIRASGKETDIESLTKLVMKFTGTTHQQALETVNDLIATGNNRTEMTKIMNGLLHNVVVLGDTIDDDDNDVLVIDPNSEQVPSGEDHCTGHSCQFAREIQRLSQETRASMEEARSDNHRLEATNEQLNSEIQELKSKCESDRDTIQRTEQLLRETKLLLSESKQKEVELQTELDTSYTTCDSVLKQVSENSQTYDIAELIRAILSDKNMGENERIREMTLQLTTSNEQNRAKDKTIEALRREKKELEQTCLSMDKTHREYIRRIQSQHQETIRRLKQNKGHATTSETRDNTNNDCVVCMDSPRELIVYPCRHVILCTKCFKKLGQPKKKTFDPTLQQETPAAAFIDLTLDDSDSGNIDNRRPQERTEADGEDELDRYCPICRTLITRSERAYH